LWLGTWLQQQAHPEVAAVSESTAKAVAHKPVLLFVVPANLKAHHRALQLLLVVRVTGQMDM
jgi:hypothetical protein